MQYYLHIIIFQIQKSNVILKHNNKIQHSNTSIKFVLFSVTGDTPPPLENTLAQQSVKASAAGSMKSTSAKRGLFQEKINDGKKNKKE